MYYSGVYSTQQNRRVQKTEQLDKKHKEVSKGWATLTSCIVRGGTEYDSRAGQLTLK